MLPNDFARHPPVVWGPYPSPPSHSQLSATQDVPVHNQQSGPPDLLTNLQFLFYDPHALCAYSLYFSHFWTLSASDEIHTVLWLASKVVFNLVGFPSKIASECVPFFYSWAQLTAPAPDWLVRWFVKISITLAKLHSPKPKLNHRACFSFNSNRHPPRKVTTAVFTKH